MGPTSSSSEGLGDHFLTLLEGAREVEGSPATLYPLEDALRVFRGLKAKKKRRFRAAACTDVHLRIFLFASQIARVT